MEYTDRHDQFLESSFSEFALRRWCHIGGAVILDSDGGTGQGCPGGPGRIAFLDRALWQQSREATTKDAFAQLGLALKCGMLDGVERGLVTWDAPETWEIEPAPPRIGNPQVLEMMVGTTGIEPVTPTMST